VLIVLPWRGVLLASTQGSSSGLIKSRARASTDWAVGDTLGLGPGYQRFQWLICVTHSSLAAAGLGGVVGTGAVHLVPARTGSQPDTDGLQASDPFKGRSGIVMANTAIRHER